jgi:hypothetical protein
MNVLNQLGVWAGPGCPAGATSLWWSAPSQPLSTYIRLTFSAAVRRMPRFPGRAAGLGTANVRLTNLQVHP